MATSAAKKEPRWVYSFEKGNGSQRELLGGKGANLAEMTSLGLPIPQGFIVTTEACREYYDSDKHVPEGLWDEVDEAVLAVEALAGKKFGDVDSPLLLSVRSGAVISMPGMMDTILNLGINEDVVEGIARRTGNERFALDLYRRFIQMFGNVVMGIPTARFNTVMDEVQRKAGVSRVAQMSPEGLREAISGFKEVYQSETGEKVPEEPLEQLRRSVMAVFESWNTRRAIDYRNYYNIPHDLGTAVNIMAMVYGNVDDDSGTGVLFTRDPATGENALYGEYLVNAQGEDVVSGDVTPHNLTYLGDEKPELYQELKEIVGRLEHHYRDSQDIEFTIEQDKLYILQTRSAKRSAKAAIKMAVDMADENIISRGEALLRVEPEQIYQLLLPRLDDKAKEQARQADKLIATGVGASPGGVSGKVVFDSDRAAEMGAQKIAVVLVRPETSADDVNGMLASAGILTGRGGTTSHAAVVARGVGKPCVTGAESIEVNDSEGYLRCDGITIREGEEISIDGVTGEVFVGVIDSIQPHISEERELAVLLDWANDAKRLGVWANADRPSDVKAAMEFGAEGIGLCRTEHMFFEPKRLELVRNMILSSHALWQNPDDGEVRLQFESALGELEKLQTADFVGIFQEAGGKPVVIRLLDPPLHEFLPDRDELFEDVDHLRLTGDDSLELAEKEKLLATVDEMRESNPMLGLRGCRLGLMHPEIYEMQTRAIIVAAIHVLNEGKEVRPEIMVPLVSHANELKVLRGRLEAIISDTMREQGRKTAYKIGTMIEVPRAALTANEIAEYAEFFSFGTNDLTQMTFGFSRDDAEGEFLGQYVQEKILDNDPFQVLDIEGVGQLIELAFKQGKETRPDLVVGICGEHGGEPSSVEFCHRAGLDYVSCSPFRVPIARLAAAQAALKP